MNDEAVYRTASATSDLLKILGIRQFDIIVFDKYSVSLKPEAKLAIMLHMTKKPSNSSWPSEN